jgi:HD-like signal output (HDOD) protein
MPAAQAQAIALLSNPDADPSELSEAVALDPGLSAAVLRAANSASSAPISPVTSVDVAVIRMGTSEIRRIVAAAVLGQSFPGLKEANVDAPEMWRFIILTAFLAERAAPDALGRPAFTAGILHDIGRLTMISMEPANYARVVAMVRDGADARYAEAEIFGVDHCAFGAQVAAAWQFAPMLVDAVAHHHEGGNVLAEAIKSGNQIAHGLGLGDGVQPAVEPTLDPEGPEAALISELGGEQALGERVEWFREALAA